MSYDHTQEGWLGKVLHWAGLLTIADAVFFCIKFPAQPPSLNRLIFILVCGLGVLFLLLARMFRTLRVCDEGDVLAVRFGPLPVFSKRFPYSEMVRVDGARSTILDGWGIHWLPGRGWIFNISGRDCVRITMRDRVVRIGTDDLPNLLEFLKTRVGA